MNMLSHELALTLQADRERDLLTRSVRNAARRTRPATKHPEPSVRHQPGLLTRLVPRFGVRAQPA